MLSRASGRRHSRGRSYTLRARVGTPYSHGDATFIPIGADPTRASSGGNGSIVFRRGTAWAGVVPLRAGGIDGRDLAAAGREIGIASCSDEAYCVTWTHLSAGSRVVRRMCCRLAGCQWDRVDVGAESGIASNSSGVAVDLGGRVVLVVRDTGMHVVRVRAAQRDLMLVTVRADGSFIAVPDR